MANSLHVGSSAASLTDLSGASYGVTLLKTAWPWMSTPDALLQNIPQRDGGATLSNSQLLRPVVFPLRIEGTSSADLLTKMTAIHRLIDPRLGNIYVKADAWSNRLFLGRFTGGWTGGYRGLLSVVVEAEFTSKWSDMLDATEITQTATISSDPDSFNVTAAGAVSGSSPAFPKWVIKNSSGSNSGAIILANTTTSETFSFPSGSVIANGTWLRLDRERWTVETSTDSGSTWTAAPGLVGSNKAIPRLNPGVQNACTITNLASGTVDVVYRPRYL